VVPTGCRVTGTTARGCLGMVLSSVIVCSLVRAGSDTPRPGPTGIAGASTEPQPAGGSGPRVGGALPQPRAGRGARGANGRRPRHCQPEMTPARGCAAPEADSGRAFAGRGCSGRRQAGANRTPAGSLGAKAPLRRRHAAGGACAPGPASSRNCSDVRYRRGGCQSRDRPL
jgi:hypothetical protein